jgi:hypothetical protein
MMWGKWLAMIDDACTAVDDGRTVRRAMSGTRSGRPSTDGAIRRTADGDDLRRCFRMISSATGSWHTSRVG